MDTKQFWLVVWKGEVWEILWWFWWEWWFTMVSSTWVPVRDQEGEPLKQLGFCTIRGHATLEDRCMANSWVFTAPLESDTPSSAGGFSCEKYIFSPLVFLENPDDQFNRFMDDHLSSAMTEEPPQTGSHNDFGRFGVDSCLGQWWLVSC